MAYYRRDLPHWQPEGVFLFITWRLHGSLPGLLRQTGPAGQVFREWDRALDRAASGPIWLKNPQIAAMIAGTLRSGEIEKQLYRLRAFVVMVNHVHVLVEPLAPGPKITQWIKGVTAREGNRLLGRDGHPFWQHESYDHWVRNEIEGQRVVRYIEANPVMAGLVERVEQWPWSSAYDSKSAQAEVDQQRIHIGSLRTS